MNENTVFAGVDNGISGGIAFFKPATNLMLVFPMPIIKTQKAKGYKNEYDVMAIINLFRPYSSFMKITILEKAQSMPGQGVSSMFTIGKNYGIMMGILAGLGLPYQLVHPRRWQTKMFADIPHKDTKAASLLTAQRLFPKTSFKATERSTIDHHGLSDAALMAYFGYLTHEKN